MSLPVFVSKSNSGVKTAVSSFSWNHTVASGTDRALFVTLHFRDASISASSVTFNGDAMTKVRSDQETGFSPYSRSELWVLVAPDEVTGSVAVTLSATSDHAVGEAADFTNVNQTNPVNQNNGANGTANASTQNRVVLENFTIDETILISALYTKGAPAGAAEGTGETLLYKLQPNGGGDTAIAAYVANQSYMGFSDTEPGDFAFSIAAIAPATLDTFRIENITVDTEQTGVSSRTKAHTTGSGSNRLLVVTTKTRDVSATDAVITGITYNGVALTKIRSDAQGAVVRTEVWQLAAPATGSNNVVVTFTGTVDRTQITIYSMEGAAQTGIPDAQAGANGAGSSVSTNVTTVANNAIIISTLYSRDNTDPLPTTGQLCRHITDTNTASDRVADSTKKKATAGATSMGWTWTNIDDYAHSVVSFAPATGTTYTPTYTDSVSMTESLLRSVTRVLSDTGTLTESLPRSTSRTVSDYASLVDTLLKYPQRVLSDALSVADSIIRSVTKLLTDNGTLTEVFTTISQFYRTLTDTATLTDILTSLRELVVTDTITVADSVVRSIIKVITDTATMTEALLRDVSRTLSDTSTITDSIVRTAQKVVSDTVSLVDSTVRSITRVVSDTLTLAESLLKSASRTLSDAVTMVEEFLGEVAAISATLLDSISLTDIIEGLLDKFYGVTDWIKAKFGPNKPTSIVAEDTPKAVPSDDAPLQMSSGDDTPTGSILSSDRPTKV